MKPNTDAASGEKTTEERAILEQVLTIFAERESLIVETAELRAEVEMLRATGYDLISHLTSAWVSIPKGEKDDLRALANEASRKAFKVLESRRRSTARRIR